jgi:hypothetical protein
MEFRALTIIGCDPGPSASALCVVSPDYRIQSAAKVPNAEAEVTLRALLDKDATFVVESLQSYGKPVGRETFETAYAIGAFRYLAEQAGATCALIPRQEYVNCICGCRGTDSVLRQALELRFGGYKKGDVLNSLNGTDLRSAYAVAVYWMDREKWRS